MKRHFDGIILCRGGFPSDKTNQPKPNVLVAKPSIYESWVAAPSELILEPADICRVRIRKRGQVGEHSEREKKKSRLNFHEVFCRHSDKHQSVDGRNLEQRVV